MTDLAIVEKDCLDLSIDATPEQYLELRSKLEFMAGVIRDARKQLEKTGVAIWERTGPIQCGGINYKIAIDRDKKPAKKPNEMAEGLLRRLGGDWEALSRCLASRAFKPGQTAIELEAATGDEKAIDEFFEVVEKKSVVGEPVKFVAAIPMKFTKKAHLSETTDARKETHETDGQ